MLPSTDPALITRCAFRLQCARLAVRTPVAMQRLAILDRLVAPDQPLTGWALILVGFRIVDEVVFPETSLGSCARGQRLGHIGRDPSLLAREELLAPEIAPISNHTQLFHAHRTPEAAYLGFAPRPLQNASRLPSAPIKRMAYFNRGFDTAWVGRCRRPENKGRQLSDQTRRRSDWWRCYSAAGRSNQEPANGCSRASRPRRQSKAFQSSAAFCTVRRSSTVCQ